MYQQLSAPTSRPARGFTLVELLVVIVIIALLVGLLVPAVQMAREAARRTQCLNNLKQLGVAAIQFSTAKDYLPAAVVAKSLGNPPMAANAGFAGWSPQILPYIERNDLYVDYMNSPAGILRVERIELLVCPSDSTASMNTVDAMSYFPNTGRFDVDAPDSAGMPVNPLDWEANGVAFNIAYRGASNRKPLVKQTLSQISSADGTRHTILMGENRGELPNTIAGLDTTAHWAQHWTTFGDEEWRHGLTWTTRGAADTDVPPIGMNRDLPQNMPIADARELAYSRPASAHSGGFHLLFCDGSARFVSEDMRYTIYAALMAPRQNDLKEPGDTIPTPAPWPNIIVRDDDI